MPGNDFKPYRSRFNWSGARKVELYEIVTVIILIGPLVTTIILLGMNLLGAGIKELVTYLNTRQEEGESELPIEPMPESDVESYIQELRREREQGQQRG